MSGSGGADPDHGQERVPKHPAPGRDPSGLRAVPQGAGPDERHHQGLHGDHAHAEDSVSPWRGDGRVVWQRQVHHHLFVGARAEEPVEALPVGRVAGDLPRRTRDEDVA